MINWVYALILGLIQGITEFFPISSSAHLKVAKHFLNISAQINLHLFDLSCHLGTMLVVVLYFRKDLKELLIKNPRHSLKYIVALAPLIPFYVLFKILRLDSMGLRSVGFFLILNALFLWITTRFSQTGSKKIEIKDALWIGSFQGLALISGLSRSGLTIGSALYRGIAAAEAVKFSFLLAIPAILGGIFLELIQLTKGFSTECFSFFSCMIGFITATISGGLIIQFAIPLLQKRIFSPFIWYCALAGILLILII